MFSLASLGLGAIALAAPIALADPPIKVPIVQSGFVLPASVCGFAVSVDFPNQHQHGRIYANGVFAAEGLLTTTVSAHGKTFEANISGLVASRSMPTARRACERRAGTSST